MVAQEGNFNFQVNFILPQKKNDVEVALDSKPSDSSPTDSEPALVPLQIEFPSGETKEGVSSSPKAQPPCRQSSNQSNKLKRASSDKKLLSPPQLPPPQQQPPAAEQTEFGLNPLGEETPAFSEIIQDRTQRHKAFYLMRLKNSQKKNNATPRPPVHGDLFTLPELPSEDESSRFSQVSENIANRMRISRSGSGERSGGWSVGSKKKHHVIMEDEVALISAI